MKAWGVAVVAGLLLAGSARGRIDGGTLLVIMLAAGGAAVLLGARRGVLGHGHGSDRARVARHEAGHAVAARAVGGRVRSATVEDGGWLSRPHGYVRWDMSNRGLRDEVQSNVTFLAAGRLAAGTREGCRGDDAATRRELGRLPARDRSAVRTAGEAHARRIVSSRRVEIDRLAGRLNETGRP